ncbi:hypothetical protein KP509_22G009100 [Ceratopteris richardii]|nr:hypothetical protein KP509_22G009100 [Ceratopteris richardii]
MSSTFLGKVIEGIWHTGIVVYGYEYYFGGGVQSCPQGQTPYGKPLKVIELGTTQIPKEVFEDYLQDIRPRYTEHTYSLLKHNCNNFSEEVAHFLLGVGIPDYILKLPEEVMSSPMGALIMPMIQQFETILKYGGVPQVPHPIIAESSRAIQTPTSDSQSNRVEVTGVNQTLQGGSANANSQVNASASTTSGKTSAAPQSGAVKTVDNAGDKLGAARARVQEEITREFASLMAEGHLRASEAAALAARRVMEKHRRMQLAPRN